MYDASDACDACDACDVAEYAPDDRAAELASAAAGVENGPQEEGSAYPEVGVDCGLTSAYGELQWGRTGDCGVTAAAAGGGALKRKRRCVPGVVEA